MDILNSFAWGFGVGIFLLVATIGYLYANGSVLNWTPKAK